MAGCHKCYIPRVQDPPSLTSHFLTNVAMALITNSAERLQKIQIICSASDLRHRRGWEVQRISARPESCRVTFKGTLVDVPLEQAHSLLSSVSPTPYYHPHYFCTNHNPNWAQ